LLENYYTGKAAFVRWRVGRGSLHPLNRRERGEVTRLVNSLRVDSTVGFLRGPWVNAKVGIAEYAEAALGEVRQSHSRILVPGASALPQWPA